ncbi:DUF305 domain-containing protein [Roseomonas sp. M0104]|uniref:DUF305 domain-containing protein n=1 Tax=Teichococcus coralli TaxID=2545983 RepID=A0A845BDZ8_9PROT|nr:DUF305 domain-containing protein [Pseudoroseomonas coralli]MXP65351.1 DUF305 domain-containing protein [Pseudoroseomonas coralli]
MRFPTRAAPPARLLLLVLLGAGAASAHEGHHRAAPAGEAPFLAENAAAMERMMAAMAIPPSGDVDRDFVAMMVPHHQGAIDMATALLRHGSDNPQLLRLAQEVIVTQQQEIAAMRLALGDPLPSAMPAPTRPGAAAPPVTSAR